MFYNGWMLSMEFGNLPGHDWEMNVISLEYILDPTMFPDIDHPIHEIGKDFSLCLVL